MEKHDFFLKGDICWSPALNSLKTAENSFLLCEDGKCAGVFGAIPAGLEGMSVKDHSGKLIIPGLTDLHTHAPQFSFRSLGMDMELLEWLEKKTFPEEAKYRDIEYARSAYGRFIEHIKKGPNTRLCVYATTHVSPSLLLMDMLEESGLVSLAGKVSMDRNCPAYLREENPESAAREWLLSFFRGKEEGRYKNTSAILTPRFIPSCSGGLMKSLSALQREHSLPVQSHLSENRKEVEWVKNLCPESENYAGAYADFGLIEKGMPCIMAHCVWTNESEMNLLAEKETYIAHCPESNVNLASGIAPARRFLERGIHTGLGSDIAGGAHTSIFRAMSCAIGVSKLRSVFTAPGAPEEKPLTLEEAFYLGTAGGGSFFGKLKGGGNGFGPAGSFEKGWDFDALVIDDSDLGSSGGNMRDRLERVVYLSGGRHIVEKYVRGKRLLFAGNETAQQ